MKITRKIKAEKSPPEIKGVKGARRFAPKTNGKHPLATYEHIPIGIVESSLEGKHLNVNEEFCRILGYEKEELLQSGIKEFTHEEDYPIDIKLHEQLVQGKIPFYRLEKRYVRKDGGIIWTELTRSIIRDSKGKPLYTMGVVLDISERKDVERVLRESVERLRLATEAAQMFLWEWDFQKRIYTLADNFEQVIGFSAGLLPKNPVATVSKVTLKEDLRVIAEAMKKAIENHSDLHLLPCRIINPENGEMVWLEVNGKIVYDEQGKPLRMFGVAQNVTERKRVQESLRESEERFRALVSQATAGIAQSDLNSRLVFVNPKLCEMLGYTESELIGKTIWELTYAGDLEENKRLFERLLAHRESYQFEKRFIRRDGSLLWTNVSVSVIRDLAGKPKGGVGVVVDISEHKKALEEIAIISRMPAENPHPLIRLTADGKVLYANDSGVSLLKYWKQKSDQEIPRELQKQLAEVFASGLKNEIEIKQNGKTLSCTLVPIREAGYVNVYGNDITERKRAEQALREKDKQLRHITDVTPVLLSQCSSDLRYLFVNRTTAEFLGSTPEEITGKPIPQIMGDEAFEAIRPYVDRVLKGERVEYEMEIPYRAAGRRFMHVIYEPERNDRGVVVGWIATGTDITERKRMEQALAESVRQQEALYRLADQLNRTNSLEDGFTAALDAILDVLKCDRASILLFDHENVMRFVAWRGLSDAYRKATEGHSPWKADEENPQPIGMNDVRTADLSDALRAVIEEEGIGSLAFIPLVSNGKLIGKFMVYFNTPHVFSEGEIELSQTIAHQLAFDIDNERQQLALRESEERYRAVVESQAEMLCRFRPDGTILFVNGAYARARGTTPEELINSNFWEFVAEADRQAVKAMLDGLTPDAPEVHIENRFETADGERWTLWTNRALRFDANGHLLEAQSSGIDITDRKRAEEALRASEALYRAIARNIPGGGVYVVDKEFRYLITEGPVTDAFGLSREMLEGHTVMEVFPDERGKRMEDRLRRIFAGESVEFETQFNGRSYWTQMAPLHDSIGQAIILTLDITERKRAEELLSESERRFREMIDALPTAIYTTDAEGRLTHFNPAAVEFSGRVPELGTDRWCVTWKLYYPDGTPMPHDQCPMAIAIKEGRVIRGMEAIAERPDGKRIWFEPYPTPLRDSQGRIVGGINMLVDITERKQAEEALRQSEERFVRFMQHLPGLAWIKDTQGHYVYANAAAEKAFGTPQEHLYGKTDDEVFPPETAAQFKENDQRALMEGKGLQVVETLHQDDGTLHYSLVSKFPIPGPDGTPALIGGTAFDITERLRAEEALRESEERFRAILRQATAGIVRKDDEGRLVYVNQAFCNMLGYTESELLGKTIWEFMYEDDIAENKQSYHRLMLEGVPFKLERRFVRQDGSVIWVDASVSPIMDATGKPQSAVAVDVDITARKQAEEALQQLNLQLEDRVLSRTAKLRAVNQTLRDEIAERERVEEALRKSEETARLLLNTAPDTVLITDGTGIILHANEQINGLFGYRPEEVLGKSVEVLIPERFHDRHIGHRHTYREQPVKRVMGLGMELFGRRKNGEEFPVDVMLTPVSNIPGWDIMVTIRDNAQRKEMENALRKSHERLRILSQRLVEVQEDERRALARELHDRVGQTLAALNINLIIINSQLSPDTAEQISTRLSDSMKLVAETITLVRDVMTDLRPAVLDDYGLEAALESYLAQFIARYDINAKFEKPDHPFPRLGPSIEMTFLRIAQEALMNIARHAQATQVNLSLRQEPSAVYMTVQDNGIGIVSWNEANRPGSHGLTIMRERAEAFGGSLRVKSNVGQGTMIEVSIPITNQGQNQVRKEKHL